MAVLNWDIHSLVYESKGQGCSFPTIKNVDDPQIAYYLHPKTVCDLFMPVMSRWAFKRLLQLLLYNDVRAACGLLPS